MERAGVSRADMERAGVSRADMERAGVSRANMERAGVSRADMERAGVSLDYSIQCNMYYAGKLTRTVQKHSENIKENQRLKIISIRLGPGTS